MRPNSSKTLVLY